MNLISCNLLNVSNEQGKTVSFERESRKSGIEVTVLAYVFANLIYFFFIIIITIYYNAHLD